MGVGKITNRIVRELIEKIVVTKKRGDKTYLLKDEEEYIVSKSEIDGAHGLPRDISSFTNELQQVIRDVGKQIIGNGIQPQYSQKYAHRFIQHVNIEGKESEEQKRRMRTGMIKLRA